MRALEAGRFLVRAANDGITAAIDPHGKIVALLPQFKEGLLRAEVLRIPAGWRFPTASESSDQSKTAAS